jgi:predicted HAD superfamily Cof-like phosphohydrolase
MSYQDDIIAFRRKFNLSIPEYVTPPDISTFAFKVNHLEEELAELKDAFSDPKLNLDDKMAGIADALVDLAYVSIGAAVGWGINFDECWHQVHAANMRKERAKPDGSNSKRGSGLDIVKPDGWVGPDIMAAMHVPVDIEPPILLRAHQIIDVRAEEGHRHYGPMDINCDDAATIAGILQNRTFTASDVLAVLVGLKFARHRFSYTQDSLLDAVAYLGALDNLIQDRGDDRAP